MTSHERFVDGSGDGGAAAAGTAAAAPGAAAPNIPVPSVSARDACADRGAGVS